MQQLEKQKRGVLFVIKGRRSKLCCMLEGVVRIDKTNDESERGIRWTLECH